MVGQAGQPSVTATNTNGAWTSADATGRRMPRHIAVIMDGNGRWAQARGQSRLIGHAAGAERAKELTKTCGTLGIEVLTLYSFSVENWNRPADEVAGLMELAALQLAAEREGLASNNVRFRHLGSRAGLPPRVLDELDATERHTASCTGLTLCLALNYGSRSEIVEAVRSIAVRVQSGSLAPSSIDEALISDSLYTAGLPDPDLVIRTAGESRVSNYLLWQISYAELHVTSTLWPDFDAAALDRALSDFAGRTRKWGRLSGQEGP
ncbi:MAG: di-trans,poly-cis-decaprenylcistransferase [Phycisphaerae bacterium]|nr:di-trans,poly-cis-decaprenylcistransferase [Phycisphaerae bacterium]